VNIGNKTPISGDIKNEANKTLNEFDNLYIPALSAPKYFPTSNMSKVENTAIPAISKKFKAVKLRYALSKNKFSKYLILNIGKNFKKSILVEINVPIVYPNINALIGVTINKSRLIDIN
jgi:hypothetical protein